MWSKKGIYNKLNREGKSIRKYPYGDDPLKIKLFGKTRECSKCGKRKRNTNTEDILKENGDVIIQEL